MTFYLFNFIFIKIFQHDPFLLSQVNIFFLTFFFFLYLLLTMKSYLRDLIIKSYVLNGFQFDESRFSNHTTWIYLSNLMDYFFLFFFHLFYSYWIELLSIHCLCCSQNHPRSLTLFFSFLYRCLKSRNSGRKKEGELLV